VNCFSNQLSEPVELRHGRAPQGPLRAQVPAVLLHGQVRQVLLRGQVRRVLRRAPERVPSRVRLPGEQVQVQV
jgi:hypothetical protein